MTKITVRYSDTGEFVSLHSVGHANSGDYGKDIVCAAISAVILGGINALKGSKFHQFIQTFIKAFFIPFE